MLTAYCDFVFYQMRQIWLTTTSQHAHQQCHERIAFRHLADIAVAMHK